MFQRKIAKGDSDMRYIVFDIYGCYNQYQKLLEKIQFFEKKRIRNEIKRLQEKYL